MTQGVVSMAARQTQGSNATSKSVLFASVANIASGQGFGGFSFNLQDEPLMRAAGKSTAQRKRGRISRHQQQTARKAMEFSQAMGSVAARHRANVLAAYTNGLANVLNASTTYVNDLQKSVKSQGGVEVPLQLRRTTAETILEAAAKRYSETFKSQSNVTMDYEFSTNAQNWKSAIDIFKAKAPKKATPTDPAKLFTVKEVPLTQSKVFQHHARNFRKALDTYARSSLKERAAEIKKIRSSSERKRLGMMSKVTFLRHLDVIRKGWESGRVSAEKYDNWNTDMLAKRSEIKGMRKDAVVANIYFECFAHGAKMEHEDIVTKLADKKVPRIVYEHIRTELCRKIVAAAQKEGKLVYQTIAPHFFHGANGEEPTFLTKMGLAMTVAKTCMTPNENTPENWRTATPAVFCNNVKAGIFTLENATSRAANDNVPEKPADYAAWTPEPIPADMMENVEELWRATVLEKGEAFRQQEMATAGTAVTAMTTAATSAPATAVTVQ